MHQFKDSFCLANPLGSCLWKFRCALFWTFTTVLLDHTGEKPLVLFSEESQTVLVFTVFILTVFDFTESTDFVASAKSTNICSWKAL